MNDTDTTTVEVDKQESETRIAGLREQLEQASDAGLDDAAPVEAKEAAATDTSEKNPDAVTLEPKAKTDETPAPKRGKAETKPAEGADKDSEHNRFAASMRIKAEESERKIAELTAKVAEQEKRVSVPQPEQRQTINADQVFDALMRARGGEYTNPGQNENVHSAAVNAIQTALSGQQVAEVLNKAMSNGYGERSAEIADMASKFLPLVQQREMREMNVTQDQQRQERQGQAARQQELQQAVKEFKSYADANTPEAKFMIEWDKTVLPTLPEAWRKSLEASPLAHARTVDAIYKRESVRDSQITKLQQENQKLKAQKAAQDASPESSSAPVDSTKNGGDSLAEKRRRLMELSDAG